jgi:hypothetical protein
MGWHERPRESLTPGKVTRTWPRLPKLRGPARVVGYVVAGTGVVAAGQVLATLVTG